MKFSCLIITTIITLIIIALSSSSTLTQALLPPTTLTEGASLRAGDILSSPDSTFSAGFYEVGHNAYCFAVWFQNSAAKTVVWMANRDRPVSSQRSSLTLLRSGNMILAGSSGSAVWSTDTYSASETVAELLDTGNLVLKATGGSKETLWESFDFPTNTLLPRQVLMKNTTLVSMRGRGSYGSGVYKMKFDDSNVLDLIYDGPRLSSIYFPRTTFGVWGSGRTPYNSSRVASLDELGQFVSSDRMAVKALDYGLGPKRRLTLDYDGILRLYSLEETSGDWTVTWLPENLDSCLVDGLCGENGICSYKGTKPGCTCPHGFEQRDVSDWSKGCEPMFDLSSYNSEDKLEFVRLHNTDYYGYDLDTYKIGITFKQCRNSCLADSRCKGFGYAIDGYGQCYPKSYLVNGFHKPDIPSVMYLKVPRSWIGRPGTGSGSLDCRATRAVVVSDLGGRAENRHKSGYTFYLLVFVGCCGAVGVVCLGLLWWWFVFRRHVDEEMINMGYIALAMGFKRFGYKELKKATWGFKEEIGKGGFGSVYKGVLEDGRAVAVKRLEGVLQGSSEFWAEVSVIGTINHMNLVKLWGFCAEDKHKLLVYEYVDNGSLDKLLFSDSSGDPTVLLGLRQRYNIAVGTAKGLAYLHEECLEWVLHCDIKPQNILLDGDLEPKVSDFGLSKLFKDIDAGFSQVRGTRGYLAPEWMMNLKIDAKADVYSYGMVLLELLSGKCVSNFMYEDSRNGEFNHLVRWASEKIKQNGINEVIDRRLLLGDGDFDAKKAEVLATVALLCVQEDRNLRPAMSKVVELLTMN